MARLGQYPQFRVGQMAVQQMGRFRRADQVAPPVDDDGGDFRQLGAAVEDGVFLDEITVHGVVQLDAGLVQHLGGHMLVQFAGVEPIPQYHLPAPQRPGAGGAAPGQFVAADEALVYGRDGVVALRFRQAVHELRPAFRVNTPHAVRPDEPLQVPPPGQEAAAQHQAGDFGRVLLGVEQGQGRAPGAAEQQPALHLEVLADVFQVAQQVGGGVVAEVAVGRGASRAALVHQDGAVFLGVEKAPVVRLAAGAGTAVQIDHRQALRVAAFLHVEVVVVPFEMMGGVRFDGWVERFHSGHWRARRPKEAVGKGVPALQKPIGYPIIFGRGFGGFCGFSWMGFQ